MKMDNNRKELEIQLKMIENLIRVSDANLKKLKDVPSECIRTSTKGKAHQYYRCDPDSGKRIYINKRKLEEIRSIVQKEYELKVSKELHQQRDRMERFIRNSDINNITEIYDSTCKAKQCLITPIITSDAEYIARWMEANPDCQNSYPAKTHFETMNGEEVKSKSEKIIADALLKENIPYRYEPRLILKDNSIKIPDFAVLNVRKRKIIYWEHFGRLSDSTYCMENFNKLMLYEKSGYRIGDNLIITMESENEPLEIKEIYEKINRYLV